MACLGAIAYDPTTRQNAAQSALTAMTAFDTTNARITFTAPANGNVLVRLRVAQRGATITMTLLGVLDGSTVKGRIAPWVMKRASSASQHSIHQAEFVVTGLTPGNSYTWDAAYAVQATNASTNYSWGGPNDATGNDAAGALVFEVWEATNLLAATLYDPGTAASKSLGTLAAMAALDTTNLRLTFTVPPSGNVLVNMRGVASGVANNTCAIALFGVMDGSTVKKRVIAGGQQHSNSVAATSDHHGYDASFVVTGLTPGNSLTWDAAYGVQVVLASQNLKWGGPNDASGNDAWGGFAYEIWAA